MTDDTRHAAPVAQFIRSRHATLAASRRQNVHNPVDSRPARFYVIAMDTEIDAIGLLCPLPVLRLRKRMMPLPQGTRITLLADDPAAIVDVPHFCNEAGHTLINMTEADGHIVFVVEKG
ncbi:sulfurtransferase TusA family protein [Thiosulfatihalobacter marinus]|uniref:sulfurtransferase TusA family protein n=1 Tax=Thiosulfatihalobacter marinus TaxID=2792481 RepID=UPI002FBF1076